MKKILTLLTIAFCFNAAAQTNISSSIYSNTTWSLSASPYIITNTVTLFPGVTLNIEPGVVIKFDTNVTFNIRGTLKAIGTLSDTIKFTSNTANPNMYSWQGLFFDTNLGAIANIKFCSFEYARQAVSIGTGGNGPITVSRTLFRNNYTAYSGYTGPSSIVTIDSCFFDTNFEGIGYSTAYVNVQNSFFVNNTFGIYSTEIVNATNCFFSCNYMALYILGGDFQNCTIMNNIIGVNKTNTHALTLQNSIISKNDTGIILSSVVSADVINNNKICSNNIYNILHKGSYNKNLANNCWCTTDSTTIRGEIYDGYNNANLGLVSFEPVLSCTTTGIPIITNCLPTGTESINNTSIANTVVTIYPNPTQNIFTIGVLNNNIQTLAIYDINGDQILVQNIQGTTTIDAGNFNAGIYNISITSADGVINKRLIIIK